MTILHNGKLVENPQISLSSPAVLFGRGAFESFVTLEGGRIFNLSAHLHRLQGAMKALGLGNYPGDQTLRVWLKALLEAHGDAACKVKVLALPEGLYLFADAVPTYPNEPLRLITHKGNRGLWQWKSTSYLESLLAFEVAQEAGADEALLVNHHGTIYEGSRSNFLWIQGGKLRSKKRGVLPGTTRDFLAQQAPLGFHWETLHLDDLGLIDGALVSNAGRGLALVGQIDETKISICESANNLISWFNESREQLAEAP